MLGRAETLGVDLVDVFRAGRPRGEPAVFRHDLQPAEVRAIARRLGELGRDLFARERGRRELVGRELLQHVFLRGIGRRVDTRIERRAGFARDRRVVLSWVAARARRDFRRQQAEDDPILVGRPHRAVALHEGRAGALFADKAEVAADEAVDEPFEADRHFHQLAAEPLRHAVDDGGRNHRLADRRLRGPFRAMAEQIVDRGRQIMVRVHQPARARHDTVPVGVGIVGEGHVEFRLQIDQLRHGVGRGAVHADLAVPVLRCEPEGGVDQIVHNSRVDPVFLDDRRPVVHGSAAQRIDADLHPGRADRLHVQHGG